MLVHLNRGLSCAGGFRLYGFHHQAGFSVFACLTGSWRRYTPPTSTPFNAHTFRSSANKDGTESSIIRYPPRKRHLQLILGDLSEALRSRTGVVVKACKNKTAMSGGGGGGGEGASIAKTRREERNAARWRGIILSIVLQRCTVDEIMAATNTYLTYCYRRNQCTVIDHGIYIRFLID